VTTLRCLTPGCGKVVRTRNLCAGCYSRLHKRVAGGKVTGGWAGAEAAGMCGPSTASGPAGKTPAQDHPWRGFNHRRRDETP
jgi:hypothetical protein